MSKTTDCNQTTGVARAEGAAAPWHWGSAVHKCPLPKMSSVSGPFSDGSEEMLLSVLQSLVLHCAGNKEIDRCDVHELFEGSSQPVISQPESMCQTKWPELRIPPRKDVSIFHVQTQLISAQLKAVCLCCGVQGQFLESCLGSHWSGHSPRWEWEVLIRQHVRSDVQSGPSFCSEQCAEQHADGLRRKEPLIGQLPRHSRLP